MALLRRTSCLLALAMTVGLVSPAGAEQVFQHVSTGTLRPLPTPTGVPVYDAYYPCYWGNGSHTGHGPGRHSNSGTGTWNGERFYPYDPRSTGRSHGHTSWNCGGWGQNAGTGRHPGPRPTHLPVPTPPRRVPLAHASTQPA